ncbi:DUF2345 domain-containing protein, partial [Vogesella facilis]
TQETGPEEIKPDNAKGAKKTDGHLQHHAAALKAWEAGSNTDKDGKTAKEQVGQQPLLILSAPAGLVASTGNALTLAAGTNIDQVAQRDLNQTSGRRWLHNVGQHISLFVAGVKDRVTLKLIAAKGKVQLQAQSDAMELTADKDITITSCKDKIHIAAAKEILLNVGGGAYIRIAGGNIEVHCPGTVSVKGAEHDLSGPDSLSISPPLLPSSEFANKHSLRFAFEHSDEMAQVLGVVGKPYEIRNNLGHAIAAGKIPKNGKLPRIMLDEPEKLQLIIGGGKWQISELAPLDENFHMTQEGELSSDELDIANSSETDDDFLPDDVVIEIFKKP